MEIRTFKPQDLERLQEITVDSFEGVSIDRNIEAHDIAQDAEANPDGIFVAEEDGRVVGYVTTRLNRFKSIGQIPNLAVDPAYRSRGIASTLIERALDYLRAEGMAMAKIETLVQN